MEDQKQLEAGTWDKLGEPDPNQIKFELDKPQLLVMRDNKPEEVAMPEGVYYKFFTVDGKFFNTSAKTLLYGLKKLNPLKDKKVNICKKILNGRQLYDVTAMTK